MRFISPNTPFFDNVSGAPVALGTAYFGVANTDPKTNPKVPYADSAFTTPLSAELALDVAGKIQDEVWLNGTYSLIVEDADGVQVFNEPYITPPAGGGGGGGTVDSVVAGSGISVNSSDPANPVVSSEDVPLGGSTTATSFILTDTHLNQFVETTGASNITITIPTEVSNDLGYGFTVSGFHHGTGTLSFETTGITLRYNANLTNNIPQYGAWQLVKSRTAANTWVLFGYLVVA